LTNILTTKIRLSPKNRYQLPPVTTRKVLLKII